MPIADAPHSNTCGTKNYVIDPKNDTRVDTDVPTENSDKSNLRLGSNIRHETPSNTSTDSNSLTDQKDEPNQGSTFSRGGKDNLPHKPKTNFSHLYISGSECIHFLHRCKIHYNGTQSH